MPSLFHRPRLEEADPGNAMRRSAVAELLQVLIDNGCNVNQREGQKRGATPLMNCAKSWQVDAVKLLLAAGAEVSLRDNAGWTALMVANCAADEISSECDQTANREVSRLLLDAGANPNDVNADGMTALFQSALSRNAGAISLMISRGADPDIFSKYGRFWSA